MLSLISLGLSPADLTRQAIETARACDKLYAEFYTNKKTTELKTLESLFQKPVQEVTRADLEDRSRKIVSEAKTRSVGIIVSGDCLTATTHLSLLQECREKGVSYKIIHGPGICNYILNTGLQSYKFGKTAALPAGQLPPSLVETIRQNQSIGAHTLLLLDVQMDIPAALSTLPSKIRPALSPDTKIIACHSLGLPGETIRYSTVSKLLADQSLAKKTPACLILPGPLHFTEEEFLQQFSVPIQ